jgi:hypothetical protein
MKTWAEANGADNLDLERETAQFLDHHAAKGSTFVDWTRAWQTWIRNQVKWATQRIASSAETAPKIVALRWDPDDL